MAKTKRTLNKRAMTKKRNRGMTGSAGAMAKGSVAGLVKIVVPKFLEMINTIKMYHWKTTSYSTHKATDQLFEDLNKKTDEFVEVLLGKGDMNRDVVLNFPSVKISSFSTNAECKKHIEQYIQFLLALPSDKNFKIMLNVDLLAIRDEIVAVLNQFLYLLTLK